MNHQEAGLPESRTELSVATERIAKAIVGELEMRSFPAQGPVNKGLVSDVVHKTIELLRDRDLINEELGGRLVEPTGIDE